MLVVFAILFAWTAACWFAEPFLHPFLGLFPFAVDPAYAALITGTWGLLGTILWALRSGRQFAADVVGELKSRPWHYAGLAAVFALFFALQLPGLIAVAGTHNSDSAIVGLTSFHIVDGETHPVYFYGNHFNGSLVAHVSALFHVLFGRSVHHVHLVNVLFYFGFLVAVYLIARRLWDGKTALAAALIAALPPGIINLLIRNTHVSPLVFFGALALYIALRIVEEEEPRWQLYFWLGLVLGVGVWVQLQTAFYGIAVVAALFFKDKLFFARPRFYAMPAGLLIGGVPALVDFYYYQGVMLTMFTRQAEGGADIFSRFLAGSMEFLVHVPALIGLKWSARGEMIFPEIVFWAVIAVVLAMLAAFIYANRKTLFDAVLMRDINIGPAIAIVFPALTWFVMSFTERAQPIAPDRFFYLFWTTLPLILAAALYKSEGLRRWFAIAGLAVVVVVFAATYPLYYQNRLLPRDAKFREWVDYCRSNDISTYYSEFWRAYLVTFLTGEQIIGSNILHWKFEYYPPYYSAVCESPDKPAYFFNSNNLRRRFETQLDNLGIGYREDVVALGTVVTGLQESIRPHQLARIKPLPYGARLAVASVRGVWRGDEEGSIRVVELAVTNSGEAALLASGRNGHVSLELRDSKGKVTRDQPLSADIEPGETISWRVLLETGEAPGGRISARLLVNGLVLNEGKEPLDFDLEPTGRPLTGRELDPLRSGGEENSRVGEDYLFFSGWGSMIQQGRRLVRESGAAESEIGFFLIRKRALQLTLVLRPYKAPGFPSHPVGVRISCNGRVLAGKVPLYTPIRLKIELPAHFLTEGINRLTLSYDFVEPPYRMIDRRVVLSVKPHAIVLNRISFRRSDSDSEEAEIEYSIPGKDED